MGKSLIQMMKAFSALAAVLMSLESKALSQNAEILVKMETRANAVAQRNPEGQSMPHYEIPLRLLRENKQFNLDESIYKSLVFERDGETYVRWVVNPEDSKWYKAIEGFMKSQGLLPERKTHFIGYQTASRSYILEDPKTGAQFSLKSSTDRTGGNWRDKKQEYSDGMDIRLISDYVAQVAKKKAFENLVVMYEPLTFGLPDVDQSIVVRELGAVSRQGDTLYVPGFSVLHSKTGREIALKNGSSDPYEFWTEHYIKPVARAAAEFSMRTGLWFDSPHSQNFLVEMDSNFRPTGRIVLRDLGDVYVNKDILKAMEQDRLLKKFSSPENIRTELYLGFGPLHGNTAPDWVSANQYQRWGKIYNTEVNNEVSKRTGIPVSELKPRIGTDQFSYIDNYLSVQSSEWKGYIHRMQAPAISCSVVLAQ